MKEREPKRVSGSPVSGGLPEQGFTRFSPEEEAELESLSRWLGEVWDDPEDLTAQREKYQNDPYGKIMETIERRRQKG